MSKMKNPFAVGDFAVVPNEALHDRRLSAREFKVLVTLLSFVRESPTVWPFRKTIAELCGIDPSHVSQATAALVKYGWLKKVGNGGKNQSTRYTITLPFTRADSARVKEVVSVKLCKKVAMVEVVLLAA